MPQPLKVLIAEDNPDDAELMLRELRRAGFEPDWQRVDTEATFLERLVPELDVILSDYEMGQFNAARALDLVKQSGLEVPFILVSGTIGEETAVAVIKNGATDYLMKDRLGRLGEAVSHALEEFRLRHERRQADEALRTAHVQLGQMLEHSPAILYVLKLDGDRAVPHLISENVTALLGFTVAEASHFDWWAGQLHPDDRERAISSVAETIGAGTSLTEYRLRHKDGHYCWVDDSRRSILDATGKPVELIGVWTDITERKRAEETIGQGSGFVVRDRRKQMYIDIVVLVAMTATIYFLAANFDWFEAVTRWVLAHEFEQLDEIILTTVFVAAGLAIFAFRRWRETEIQMTSHQQVRAAMGLLHDELDRQVKQRTEELSNANQALHAEIADRRETDLALRESEERFRQMTESIDEMFYMTDPDNGSLLYISPAYEKIWGRTRASLHEFPEKWVDAIHPEDRERVTALAASKHLRSYHEENYRIVRPDGSIRWLHDRSFPIRNAAGKVDRMVGVTQDVTDKKELETQFFRAQRLESIGTLASGIAHDLNNILAPVMMAAPLIRASKTPANTEKILTAVEASVQRGAKLVRQLLAFGRGDDGEKTSLSVAPVIREVLAIAQQTFPKNVTIASAVAEQISPILADATQVHQILLNLCVNGRDAMPQGGTLTVAAKNVRYDSTAAAAIPGAKSGDYLQIKVTDTGTGMTPEIVEKIFDPFFTTKEMGKGTGLGLATVLGLVKSHEGFVTLVTEPGKGSTFTVHFPAVGAARQETIPPFALAASPLGNGELLLLVDDEVNIRDTVRGALITHGYAVVVAQDGIEGISRFAMAKNQIKLVLTDLDMPIMDGVTMLRIFRQLDPKLKVIVSSGILNRNQANSSRMSDLTAIGVTSFLDKPYTTDQLLRAVHAALAS